MDGPCYTFLKKKYIWLFLYLNNRLSLKGNTGKYGNVQVKDVNFKKYDNFFLTCFCQTFFNIYVHWHSWIGIIQDWEKCAQKKIYVVLALACSHFPQSLRVPLHSPTFLPPSKVTHTCFQASLCATQPQTKSPFSSILLFHLPFQLRQGEGLGFLFFNLISPVVSHGFWNPVVICKVSDSRYPRVAPGPCCARLYLFRYRGSNGRGFTEGCVWGQGKAKNSSYLPTWRGVLIFNIWEK